MMWLFSQIFTFNMNSPPKVAFEHFLNKFPELPLPVTLGEETARVFSRNNDPLPIPMIEEFLLSSGEPPADEFTEFVPCFRISLKRGRHAIVFWRASLLNYQYRVITFTKGGVAIDVKTVAGTFSDGQTLTRSVATIDEDHNIHVVSGQMESEQERYQAAASTANHYKILSEGRIAELA